MLCDLTFNLLFPQSNLPICKRNINSNNKHKHTDVMKMTILQNLLSAVHCIAGIALLHISENH